MKQDAFNLTDQQKKEFLGEHFGYEVDMLSYSAYKIKQLGEQSKGKHVWEMNMPQETFVLHSRNLIEFFYGDKQPQYPCDARAYDFFEDKRVWEAARPQKTSNMVELMTRSGKEMAHITYLRISGTPPEKSWDDGQLNYEILKVVKSFLENLPSIYLSPELEAMRKQIQKIA